MVLSVNFLKSSINFFRVAGQPSLFQAPLRCLSSNPTSEPPIPPYEWRDSETVDVKRARLLYQSRKRGMLENDLLLSTFAAKHLKSLDEILLNEYDRLLNVPSNDWDIYYWAIGQRPVPDEFNNKIMDLLKEHVKNVNREKRLRQPDLA